MKKRLSFLFLFLLLSIYSRPGWTKEQKYDWFTYSLLLQLWDTQTLDGQNVSIVRRAENKFTFRFDPSWSAVVMLDPSKTRVAGKDDSWLQDAFLQGNLTPQWQWKIGQYKIPFTEEGLHSAAQLDTIERAQFNSGANKFGDIRELGSMLQYKDSQLLAQFGTFSGDPTNQSIGATLKEGVARVVFSPTKHFNFGGSISRGSRHNVDKPLDHLELSNKNGMELSWDDKPWLFQVEWVNGRLDVPTVKSGVVTAITPATREGWYAKIRYDINSNLQLVLREDAIFANVNTPGNGERDITVGVNYWFQKKPQEIKLQVNYVNRRSFLATPVPSLWRGNLQFFF